MNTQFFTVDDIARHFNVSESTVRRWIQSGKLEGQKAGAQWRFDRNLVMQAFEQGLLSGATDPASSRPSKISHFKPPAWATALLSSWRASLEGCLRELQPDHVIVNDRRGAKVWQIIMGNSFEWGRNLWHSTAVQTMKEAEFQRTFRAKNVLLFDEMMQHGRDMHELRLKLEGIKATVNSFVCICRRSHLESGETWERRARVCENLADLEFGRRATTISRLLGLSNPPLDVDHLVVRGKTTQSLSTDIIVQKLANWGRAFVVTRPDPDSNRDFLALTLDRPQFFDTGMIYLGPNFHIFWDGPCKIRLYIKPEACDCFCAFIVYPRIMATLPAWSDTFFEAGEKLPFLKESTSKFSTSTHAGSMARIYENLCLDLAINLLRDFRASGAAEDVGIRLQNTPDALDASQLRATFGLDRGTEVEKKVRTILSEAHAGKRLFSRRPISSPPLAVREKGKLSVCSHDAFACRADFLDIVPVKSIDSSGNTKEPPITYATLVRQLETYSESTIGRILDYEIDWGTIKPVVHTNYSYNEEDSLIEVERGFYRGEFDPPLAPEHSSIHIHDDDIMRKTLAICPMALEQFLRRVRESEIGSTHFAKLFANIWEDWPKDRFDALYYFVQPYKYGLIPVVRRTTSSGLHQRLENFLLDHKCIAESEEPAGSKVRRAFRPNNMSTFTWRAIYDKRIDGLTKAYISGLIRLYAAIQERCDTKRSSENEGSGSSVFRDALVVLASARNQRTTYDCGLFELEDWQEKGENLFETLKVMALTEQHYNEPVLKPALSNFTEPAALLSDKIEMYRNIPYLRHQIEKLRDSGDFEMAHVVLETVDVEPHIESEPDYPVGNLEWACRIMRGFSSFARQVLTRCGLDVDNRSNSEKLDPAGKLKDAAYYLADLLKNAPELEPWEGDLQDCIKRASKGILTTAIGESLSRTFQLILGHAERRIPRTNSRQGDILCEDRHIDLIECLQEINLPDPYAVAIADTKAFVGMARLISRFADSDVDEVVVSLHRKLRTSAEKASNIFPDVHFAGQTSDTLILASPNPDNIFLCVLDLMRGTTQMMEHCINELRSFGLLRVGIAWHQRELGSGFGEIRPGKTAHQIGDKRGRKIGDVTITEAILQRLSPGLKRQFSLVDDETCEQGQVYIRHWNRSIDVKSPADSNCIQRRFDKQILDT